MDASLQTLPALASSAARIAVQGEYTTDGALLNASLIRGLFDPVGIQVSAMPEPSTVLATLAG